MPVDDVDRIETPRQHDEAVETLRYWQKRLENPEPWDQWYGTEEVACEIVAEHTAVLDDYYQRENAEQEKANMSEERKPLWSEKEIKELVHSRFVPSTFEKLIEMRRSYEAKIAHLEKRIAELEAAQRPANPAGDDITELIEEAQRDLRESRESAYDCETSTFFSSRATAYATVAMAMMRLREYES